MAYVRTRRIPRPRPLRLIPTAAPKVALSATLSGHGTLTASLTVVSHSLPIFQKPQPRPERILKRRRLLQQVRQHQRVFIPTAAPKVNLAATLAGAGHLSGGLSVSKNLTCILAGQGHLTASLAVPVNLSATLRGSGRVTALLLVTYSVCINLTGIPLVAAPLAGKPLALMNVAGTPLVAAPISGKTLSSVNLVGVPLAAISLAGKVC